MVLELPGDPQRIGRAFWSERVSPNHRALYESVYGERKPFAVDVLGRKIRAMIKGE